MANIFAPSSHNFFVLSFEFRIPFRFIHRFVQEQYHNIIGFKLSRSRQSARIGFVAQPHTGYGQFGVPSFEGKLDLEFSVGFSIYSSLSLYNLVSFLSLFNFTFYTFSSRSPATIYFILKLILWISGLNVFLLSLFIRLFLPSLFGLD